jgi:hypothetical protein
MRGIRYTDEFKAEALKQITERGHSAVEVAKRLGITDKSHRPPMPIIKILSVVYVNLAMVIFSNFQSF